MVSFFTRVEKGITQVRSQGFPCKINQGDLSLIKIGYSFARIRH